MLTFNEERHEYHFAGKRVPSVTQVLAPLHSFERIQADVLEVARQEGQALHAMVELDIKGDLDVEELPEWMHGKYKAWLKFREDTGFEMWASEERVYHPTFMFAGTLDLAGAMPKLKGVNGGAIIDVKRSFYAIPSLGYQTSAYEAARNASAPSDARTRHRFGLRLDDNGQYRLHRCADANDFTVFLACLTLLRAGLKIHETKHS